MLGNSVNHFGVASASDHGTLPETELWTQVILQAINDLHGHTALAPGSAKDFAKEWFASESDAVCSFIWTCQIIDVDPNFIRSLLAKNLRMKNPFDLVASVAQGAKAFSRKNSPLQDNLDRAQGRPAFKRLAYNFEGTGA
jgi:hypothetical protein